MTKKTEWGAVAALFVLVAALCLAFQKPLTYHDGQGWDGVSYFQMAQSIAHRERPSAIGPFAFRLGTPALVAWLFPGNLLLGFKLINLAACLLSTALLTLWLRRFIENPWLRLALIAAYLTQWHAPLRFTAHYAAYTDPWLFVFVLGALLRTHSNPPGSPLILRSEPPSLAAREGRRSEGRTKPGWVPLDGFGWGLALLCLVGALFREAVVAVPLALFLASRGRQWLPLLGGILGITATHVLATQTDSYSFARTVGQWAYNKPLPVYVHGLFIAFGLALVLPLYFWRTSAEWLKSQPVLAWTLASFLVLGWVGGSDTERIVYWAMPIVYALFGAILEAHALPKGFLVALAALQLLSHRVFQTLPDFPGPYPELWSYQASRGTQLTGLLLHVFAVAVLWGWLRQTKSRERHALPAED